MPDLIVIHSVVVAGVIVGSFLFMKDEGSHL